MKIFASTLLAMGVAQAAALESSQPTDEHLVQTPTFEESVERADADEELAEYSVSNSHHAPGSFQAIMAAQAARRKAAADAAAGAKKEEQKAVTIVKVDRTNDNAAKADAKKKADEAAKAAAIAKAKKDAAHKAALAKAEIAAKEADKKAFEAAARLARDQKIADAKALKAKEAAAAAYAAAQKMEALKLAHQKKLAEEKARAAREKAAKDKAAAAAAHVKIQKAKADKASADKIKAKQEAERQARRTAALARQKARVAAIKAEKARVAAAKDAQVRAAANRVITNFEVFKQKKNWYDARRVCRKWGGALVSILSEEEQNKVRKMIKPHVQAYWIGARNVSRQGTANRYKWLVGKTLKYKNWGKGQPDGKKLGASGACVAIVGGSHWMNANCFHKARFICAKRSSLKDVNASARDNERTHIAAHKAELARRAAIVARLQGARKERRHAEDKMRHAAHLKMLAEKALKQARILKHKALLRLKNERRLAHIANLKLQLSIKNKRIAEAERRSAVRLSIAAKKRADRNAYLAGIAAGKARAEHARKLREIEKAKIAHAAAHVAMHAARHAIRERNIEIKKARDAHHAKLRAEATARDEYRKWQSAVEYSRKMLVVKVKTEKRTHQIQIHQARLTAHAKMHFVRAQVARIAAVKRAVHATKIWVHMKSDAHKQKVKQVAAEKFSLFWKNKRDHSRRQRDIAIAEKNKAMKSMHRDHGLYTISLKAKRAAELKLAGAVKLVTHWTSQVKVAHNKYNANMVLRKNAQGAYKSMVVKMHSWRLKADKMEALMKESQRHWTVSKSILKAKVRTYHAGVHAYKKSHHKWSVQIKGTKKDHLRKQMLHKKSWMIKVTKAQKQAKKQMHGFKVNVGKWRARWLSMRHKLAHIKRRVVSAKVYLRKVTIIMRNSHRTLHVNRRHLKHKIQIKVKFMRKMHKAKRHLAIQLKATATRKVFAAKMFKSMKVAVKVFIGHRRKMFAAIKAAAAQKVKTFKAVSVMRAEYATMMAWKKAQARAHRREHSAFARRSKAIKANKDAYARYLLAVKARRHAYGRKQAAIRARRHAQLVAAGQLKAQNRAEASAARAVSRLARATRIMRNNLRIKLAAEKRLRQQTKARKHAERHAFHHHRQAVRREKRARTMHARRLAAMRRFKLSLAKLRIARAAATKALRLKLHAQKAARISMAKDKRIIHTWHVKARRATHLRLRAQRAARIAHGKYMIALRLKAIALRHAKIAKVTARKAHGLMVQHRKLARAARRAMRIAQASMKKAQVHKNRMIAHYRMHNKRRVIAHRNAHLAIHRRNRAIHAWKISVQLRKVSFAKRAAAIKRKIAYIRDAKRWAVKAHSAHHSAKRMHVTMTSSHKLMIHTRHQLTIWIRNLAKAASAAAKKRAHEKITQLRVQLAHRVKDHKIKLVKEKNLRAIWMKLRARVAHVRKLIIAVHKRIHHWRSVYRTQKAKVIRALRIKAMLIRKAKIAARHMKLAIQHRLRSVRRHKLAIHRFNKAVAFKKLQVILRLRAEKRTKMYKLRHAKAVAFGRKQKAIAIRHGRMAIQQRRISIKQNRIFKNQSNVRRHAKVMHARFYKQVVHFRRVAHALKLRVIHYRAVTVRLNKERRRVNLKVEDQVKRINRVRVAITQQKKLRLHFLHNARKQMRLRKLFQIRARSAHKLVHLARREHRRQVHLKKRMLASYARLTARNLRNATNIVNHNKSITRRAIAAKKHFMNKRAHHLRRKAVEVARKFTIRKVHTTRRAAARRIANRVVSKHDKIRARAAYKARMYIRHTVNANKRAQLAKLRRNRIIVVAKKAAALNAKLICNIRLSASMKRHMFDSEMCQRSKKFLNKLTDEKADKKRLASERQVVKFWCTARNARRAQVIANKKCKSGGNFKAIALHNESMANVATLAAWGSPAQKRIPKNGKGHISYKAWYAKVMKLAGAMSKTPCPVMPGAPAKSLIVHTRHHKSVKLVGGNTMVLTHTNYYYTKPCTQKCKVVKRSIVTKKNVN